jgi:hypothetical protein
MFCLLASLIGEVQKLPIAESRPGKILGVEVEANERFVCHIDRLDPAFVYPRGHCRKASQCT